MIGANVCSRLFEFVAALRCPMILLIVFRALIAHEFLLNLEVWKTGMHPRYWLVGLGLMATVFLVGCGEEPPEALVPVSGTILVNGKPMDGITITFIPEIAKNSRGGAGTTSVDGSFTVTDLTQNLPGLAPGKYMVSYSRMRLPNGDAAPEPKEDEPVNPGIIRVETLPSHLQTPDPRNPASFVEIPKEGNTSIQLMISAR